MSAHNERGRHGAVAYYIPFQMEMDVPSNHLYLALLFPLPLRADKFGIDVIATTLFSGYEVVNVLIRYISCSSCLVKVLFVRLSL